MHGRVRTSIGSIVDTGAHMASEMKKGRRSSMDPSKWEHKRPSMVKPSSPKPPPPASLDMVIESPPLVFYGPASTSTGALLSGQLVLVISEREMRMTRLTVALLTSVTSKKPVHAHCPECATKVSDLMRLELLKEPHTFKKGRHAFPFSYLLPGHLPATSYGTLGSIEYKLSARAMSSTNDGFHYDKALSVERAIIPVGEKTSTRIFPPTNITANIVLPSVIHPTGEFPVQFRMCGIVRRGKDVQTRWRLRKMNWRIEEHSKMVSPACPKHSQKLGGEGKGIMHESTRIIGSEDFKSGWKTDFDVGNDSEGGLIEMEFQAGPKSNLEPRPACDVDGEAGLMTVKHSLIIELVVAEEYCPSKNSKLVTPTGAARVLRMTFNLLVTARMGLGIAWDEEQPPMYSDVPASPPHYTHMEDYVGDPLEYEDLDRLHLRE
ncbi:MAG: hypothetical protein M1816_004745 [Peltula sp. TS41687]|nr:MAG: hypothetical protein M1816_004745 [Peltula sp. TS41687]